MGKFSSLHNIEEFRVWLSVSRFDILVLDVQVSEELIDLMVILVALSSIVHLSKRLISLWRSLKDTSGK